MTIVIKVTIMVVAVVVAAAAAVARVVVDVVVSLVMIIMVVEVDRYSDEVFVTLLLIFEKRFMGLKSVKHFPTK